MNRQTMRAGRLLLLISSLGLAVPAAAQPTIFVPPEANSAWHNRKTIMRPTGSAIEGISIETLNAYRAERWPEFDRFCFVDAVNRTSYVGLDRATQEAVKAQFADLKHNPFRIAFRTTDGGYFVARVGIAEECKGTRGALIVIYDANTRKIADMIEWADDPFRFLWPGRDGELLAHSSCFECDDWNALYYDVSRRKFYWEYEGA